MVIDKDDRLARFIQQVYMLTPEFIDWEQKSHTYHLDIWPLCITHILNVAVHQSPLSSIDL